MRTSIMEEKRRIGLKPLLTGSLSSTWDKEKATKDVLQFYIRNYRASLPLLRQREAFIVFLDDVKVLATELSNNGSSEERSAFIARISSLNKHLSDIGASSHKQLESAQADSESTVVQYICQIEQAAIQLQVLTHIGKAALTGWTPEKEAEALHRGTTAIETSMDSPFNTIHPDIRQYKDGRAVLAELCKEWREQGAQFSVALQ